MHIEALIHLAKAAASLAPDKSFIVFGSSSAFGTFPNLADSVSTYEQTLDADLVFEPLDEETWSHLRAALGKESPFFESHGYYADINGPRAFECFPADFRDRLVPLADVPNVFAIEPNDMAVAKLIAGREKDVRLLSILLAGGYLNEAAIRTRLWNMEMSDKLIVKVDLTLKATITAARDLGYSVECPEQPWKMTAPTA